MTEWKKCRKKPVVVEYREVRGEKELVKTREGKLYGYAGKDFIIRGVNGEIYPIGKKIFAQTYVAVSGHEKQMPEKGRKKRRVRWAEVAACAGNKECLEKLWRRKG